jgi:hypothetical protein
MSGTLPTGRENPHRHRNVVWLLAWSASTVVNGFLVVKRELSSPTGLSCVPSVSDFAYSACYATHDSLTLLISVKYRLFPRASLMEPSGTGE